MHKCKAIAVTNQKGGVGKTTTAANVAIGLARNGYDVLIVDFDPQGDLTASLGWKTMIQLNIPLLPCWMTTSMIEKLTIHL